MSDLQRLFITLFTSILIFIAWQYFFELPRIKETEEKRKIEAQKREEIAKSKLSLEQMLHDSEQSDQQHNQSIKIRTDKVTGSISLRGLRFNDVKLEKYRTEVGKESEPVSIFVPSKDQYSYFAEFGWVSTNKEIDLPNNLTIWQADQEILEVDKPLTLSWKNKDNVLFKVELAIDKNYMFFITQSVINNSNKTINLVPFGLINRNVQNIKKSFMILHEGLIGTFNNILKEVTYEDLIDKKLLKFESNTQGWFGITDKYWLSAIIPVTDNQHKVTFTNKNKFNENIFQADFLGKEFNLLPGQSNTNVNYLFVGPKKAEIIDYYQEKYNIDLFDRAIDYGWFYFLTKPLFKLLTYLNSLVGNYGIAILLMTLIVKLLLFPIANKSFRSMSKMKKVQPELNRIKELYGNDKIKINQEMMALYKKEKINPLSGCLPLFIQIPVFFSLYKVIFISIEMRHAPFFGWIKDLSSPDPTSILNLFGLLPYESPAFLSIGVLPLIMGLTMFLQQKMSPEPSDPIQAKVMKFLPLIFIFLFHNFPSGLMIYWSFSNILSILQQWVIHKSIEKSELK